LLFLIYINDIPKLSAAEDPSSEIYFTDDSKIYKVIHNRSDEQKLQTVLNLIKNGQMSGFSD